jgi:hypothetical protein
VSDEVGGSEELNPWFPHKSSWCRLGSPARSRRRESRLDREVPFDTVRGTGRFSESVGTSQSRTCRPFRTSPRTSSRTHSWAVTPSSTVTAEPVRVDSPADRLLAPRGAHSRPAVGSSVDPCIRLEARPTRRPTIYHGHRDGVDAIAPFAWLRSDGGFVRRGSRRIAAAVVLATLVAGCSAYLGPGPDVADQVRAARDPLVVSVEYRDPNPFEGAAGEVVITLVHDATRCRGSAESPQS